MAWEASFPSCGAQRLVAPDEGAPRGEAMVERRQKRWVLQSVVGMAAAVLGSASAFGPPGAASAEPTGSAPSSKPSAKPASSPPPKAPPKPDSAAAPTTSAAPVTSATASGAPGAGAAPAASTTAGAAASTSTPAPLVASSTSAPPAPPPMPTAPPPATSSAPPAGPGPDVGQPENRPVSADDDSNHKKLALNVGGGLLHASDDNEASGDRGAVLVELSFRPAGSLRGLEIKASYDDFMGTWNYLQKSPSQDGAGASSANVFEQRHRIGLDVRYDVLRLIKKGLPLHVSPLLELAFVSVDSPIYRSTMFGGGGGGAIAWDVDSRTTVDASFSVVRGFVSGGGEGSVFGSVTGLFSWGAGVSLGATEWSRIRLGYVGEALDRQSTTRFTNGARLSFLVSFL